MWYLNYACIYVYVCIYTYIYNFLNGGGREGRNDSVFSPCLRCLQQWQSMGSNEVKSALTAVYLCFCLDDV